MFLCLLLPIFPLQAALRWRDHGGPAVVVDAGAATGILAVNAAARAAGITPGMTSPQAMARAMNVLILPCNLEGEACLNELLVQAAMRLSPDVELAGGGVCIADMRRAVLSARGRCWQQLAEEQIAALHEKGLEAVAGVAPAPDLAHLAARDARPVSVIYRSSAFAGALAIESLDPSPELLGILRDWGIRTVGELSRLPRGEAMARLGPEARALLQRISARHQRPLRLVREAPRYAEAFDFEYEVETCEPLLFLLRRFLEGLCERLRAAGHVAGEAVLRIPLEDGTCHHRVFRIPSPTAEVESLFRILTVHLETLSLPNHPVGIRLELRRPASPDRQQLQLFESALRDPNRFGETLARLKALVGNDCAGVPGRADTHRPDVYLLRDPFPVSARASPDPLLGLPLHRFRPPRPSRVDTTSGVPVSLHSEVAQGVVAGYAGPFRLSGNWWDSDAWHTEEWDIELRDGGLYRISRCGRNWRVEGSYEGGKLKPES